jgi:hypothetical protein
MRVTVESPDDRSASPELKQGLKHMARRTRAELERRIVELEQENAGLKVMLELERKDADRRVGAILDAHRRAAEERRAADRNRKKGIPRVQRPRGPGWNEEHFQRIAIAYEVLCQQQGRTRGAACEEVARKNGMTYTAIRSALRRYQRHGALNEPLPPSPDRRLVSASADPDTVNG